MRNGELFQKGFQIIFTLFIEAHVISIINLFGDIITKGTHCLLFYLLAVTFRTRIKMCADHKIGKLNTFGLCETPEPFYIVNGRD